MNALVFVVAVIFGLMLAEARVSRRNERELVRMGATRPAGDPYVALAVLYPAAFLAMGLEGALRLTREGARLATGSPSGEPAWFLSGALLFLASKALKYWAIRALGVRWSFRVLILPGVPLVTAGPYRYVAHPNYIAVMGELAGTAMMVGAAVTGPVTMAAFGLALWVRIRFESRMLRRAAGTGSPAPGPEGP